MSTLPASVTFAAFAAYLRPAPTNASTTRIYDVDSHVAGAMGRPAGRLVRREDAPGWFVSRDQGGVLRDAELEPRYFPTPEAALEAMAQE